MHFHLQIHAHTGHRLPVSFECMVEAMQLLPSLFIELDGSFVWRDRRCSPPFQMDGMIYDRGGLVEYVDVHGRFSKHQWLKICCIACGMSTVDTTPPEHKISELENNLRVNEPATGSWTSVQAVVRLLTEL